MVDGNKLSQVGFQYIGTPYSVMDCQAFVEKCLSDCGNHTDLPGSNSWYREVMNNGWVGSPEECKSRYGTVPRGAFLFILEQDGGEPAKYQGDGIGNASHIGLVTGTGEGAIHSSSSKGCVCESKFQGKTIKNGGWNRVGLWNQVDYGIEGNDPDQGGDDTMPEMATVHSENGKSVKMRAKPSTSCNMYWDVPDGSIVDLYQWGDDWSNIGYGGQSGYMMSQYLIRGSIVPGEDTIDDSYITVPREELQRVYDMIGDMLSTKG